MGYFRIFLVLAVMHGHFTGILYLWEHLIAVFGFFVLSGFLITRIVCEIYPNTLYGKKYYLLNRFVRIYPTYWICLCIGLLVISLIPDQADQGVLYVITPSTWERWLVQFTIIGMNPFVTPFDWRLNVLPPAWSLGTELFYYLIIGLFTGHNRYLSVMGLTISIVMIVWIYFHDIAFDRFYFTTYCTSLAFFLGSVGYHYKHTLKNCLPFGTVFLLGMANVILYGPDIFELFRIHPIWKSLTLHLSTLLFALITVRLYENNKHKPISKLEQFCADISYPMFLLQWPMGIVAGYYLGLREGQELFFYGLAYTLVLSAAVVIVVEIPMKRIRVYLRHRAILNKNSPL